MPKSPELYPKHSPEEIEEIEKKLQIYEKDRRADEIDRMGKLLEQLGESEKAKEAYSIALKIVKDYPHPWDAMAYYQEKIGELSEARDNYKEAIIHYENQLLRYKEQGFGEMAMEEDYDRRKAMRSLERVEIKLEEKKRRKE